MASSPAVRDITAAVRAWLDGLDDGQRARATFPFASPERFVWMYVPGPREGLAIRDLRPEQRDAARAIVAASLSARAAGEVAAIIALETVLGELERSEGRLGGHDRNPELYWFAVFGEPGTSEAWSWRVGGHHVAVHLTIAGDRVVGATPSFLGANPAIVPRGSLAGTATLPGEEALARDLLAALSPAERSVAIVDHTAPADILSGTGRLADVRSVPVGATPSFLGANPSIVPRGPLAGTATLPGEEALARDLLAALSPAERSVAIVDDTAPADILSGTGRLADVRSVPVGVRHADLGATGRTALERLVRHYVDRVRPDVASEAWERSVAGALGDVTFAWAGSDVPGRGHYYAVRGPAFVIEYDNTQNGANHIHAVWRELANDWGEDLLAQHLASAHGAA